MGRKQGTGKPDPGKDRTAHDAARGKKIPTLTDLSREMPTPEYIAKLEETLADEATDRSAAIMAAALLEQALYDALRCHMVDCGDAVMNSWFYDANAPFGTFSAKIKLGRALGLYGEKTEAILCGLKDIRNVFAHRSMPIDFTHPRIVLEVSGLAKDPMIGERPVRTRYISLCLAWAKLLLFDAHKHGGKDMAITYP
jgi:hypothetical protein